MMILAVPWCLMAFLLSFAIGMLSPPSVPTTKVRYTTCRGEECSHLHPLSDDEIRALVERQRQEARRADDPNEDVSK